MTDQHHPITPPPELVQQWFAISCGSSASRWKDIVTEAARWGADQELEACCEWLVANDWKAVHQHLRAARRPKPPSLKEQAQAELDRLIALIPTEGALAMAEPIRRALEQLND